MLKARFKSAQNLSSGFDEWSYAVVITTTPRPNQKIFDQLLIFENLYQHAEKEAVSDQFPLRK